ncbi:MAG: metallophosphoesterase [Firmicutes bacterium]|nr:metallophosphoesterase [Bacillota bacterium]
MKVIVISDTHGNLDDSFDLLSNLKDIDMLIHLGDFSKDVEKINEEFDLEVYNIKGNCDIGDYNTEEEQIINLKEKKVLLTHGHKYGVKMGIERLYYKAKELNVDMVLFGHSHVPMKIEYDDILFFNPGSITLPRRGSKRSYGVIEFKSKLKTKIINVE